MADTTYKLIEIVGTSKTSIEDATSNALAQASATVRHIRWFEVVETRGSVSDGKVQEWQVTLKAGFRLGD